MPTITTAPATGAQTSLFGGFKSLVENISPGVLGYLTAKEQAKAASITQTAVAAAAPAPGQTGDWRDTVSPAAPAPAAKPAWLLPSLIGGGVLVLAVLIMALRGRKG